MTTFAATFVPGTSSAPACTLLQVTGAPFSIPAYVSDFTAGTDSWAAEAGGTMTGAAGDTGIALQLAGAVDDTTTFSRTVTGLTIGQAYTFSLLASLERGTLALSVTGKTTGAFLFTGTRAPVSYSFTATATSHTIEASVKAPKPTMAGSTNGLAYIDTVKVTKAGTWVGTSITRTDANGAGVPVRLAPEGQDTDATGAMTVTDYEAALVGDVHYTLVTGDSAVTTTTVTNPADAGVWLTLPGSAVPGGPDATAPLFAPIDMVTGYDEASATNGSRHRVIGASEPISNPGPLVLRAGSVRLWCQDYPTAAAVRDLLTGGDTAHLRQVTFPGLDLYFDADEVQITPEEPSTRQRWSATVRYQEVSAPPTELAPVTVLDGGPP